MIQSERLTVAERRGQRLVIVPHAKPDIGDLIADPQSTRLIRGVEVEPLVPLPDDRGYFAELFRFGEPGIGRDFIPIGDNHIQISVTTSYPGVIKALHYHFEQTDLWVPVEGMLQVFLCDLRETSPSCSQVNTLFMGTRRPWKLRIPPGVAHGYKVIGTETACLIYATNRFYNPDDEGRIAFNDPNINYDWQSRPR
jgi:dTDP-4-dehydrorhamnose 3,5-epimerase